MSGYISGSFMATPKFLQRKNWWIIDAKGVNLGRLSSRVALILRGKHKACYTPHIDCGDSVILINAAQIGVTGRKLEQNSFFWHTGHPGGIKERKWNKILFGKYPERLLQKAIERMMPKDSPLAKKQMKSLYIYADDNHQHQAQQPQKISYDNI